MSWLTFLACGDEPIQLVEPEAEALKRLGSACAVVFEVAAMGAETTDHQVRVRDGRVRSLTLRDATCPSSALAELAPMTELIHLDLAGSSVTSLEHAPELDLADLILARTPISELAHLDRLSPSYLDISDSQVASLEGLPDSVTVLHARGLGLEVPEGRAFTYIDVGRGDATPPPPPAEPLPLAPSVDEALGDRWRLANPAATGSKQPDGTLAGVAEGDGLVYPSIPMDDRGGGHFELRAEGGEAVVWLKDLDGEWAGVKVGSGPTRTQGRVQKAGFGESLFYVDVSPGVRVHWTLLTPGSADAAYEAVQPWAEMNPTPVEGVELPSVRTSRGASGTSTCSQLDGTCTGSVASGEGVIAVDLSPFDRSSGRVSLALSSGSARVWLKDSEGTWRAYLLQGDLELFGHFEAHEHQHKRWYVEPLQGFSGLTWTVR